MARLLFFSFHLLYLLGQVVLHAHQLDLIELCLDPIDMGFLVTKNVFKDLTCAVIAQLSA